MKKNLIGWMGAVLLAFLAVAFVFAAGDASAQAVGYYGHDYGTYPAGTMPCESYYVAPPPVYGYRGGYVGGGVHYAEFKATPTSYRYVEVNIPSAAERFYYRPPSGWYPVCNEVSVGVGVGWSSGLNYRSPKYGYGYGGGYGASRNYYGRWGGF